MIDNIFGKELGKLIEIQLKTLRKETLARLKDTATDNQTFVFVTTYGIPIVEWNEAVQKEVQKELPNDTSKQLERTILVERTILNNKAWKYIFEEGLVVLEQACVRLSWKGECLVDSFDEQHGGFDELAKAIELKPSIFGCSVDLKKILASIL